MQHSFNVIFVGGGLANGLAAYVLHKKFPGLSIALLESGPSLGGNHTWSFHESDITKKQQPLLAPFVSKEWPAYDVQFPKLKRRVYSSYRSILSNQFHNVLMTSLGKSVFLKTLVHEVHANGITLTDGSQWRADIVLDGRGWESTNKIDVAYQKFVGLDVHLRAPHGLSCPILMDATVPQIDGYRFFYLLPWTDTSLLIEDTRFSDDPHLPVNETRQEIEKYLKNRGWDVDRITRSEKGVLPFPMDGNLPAWKNGVGATGTRAGLFNAATGYSTPQAIQFAEDLSKNFSTNPKQLIPWVRRYAEKHWESEWFFRLLNRLLFQGSPADKRIGIFEKFYRSPEALLGRFYAGRLNPMDYLRIFTGKPPMPIRRALGCVIKKRSVA